MSDKTRRALTALQTRYEILEHIGRGGMADVFRARDLKHDHVVALKILRHGGADDDDGAERFQREIRTMRGLTHPYILPVLDSGAADGTLYYAMPYIRGESLRDLLQGSGRLSPQHAVGICKEVAEALEYAHRLGIVHRDLKPDNILISEGHAVIADFGISKAIGAVTRTTITTKDLVLGTPDYLGPEQISAPGDVDGRTDLYSLGCTLFELLTGNSPYPGPTRESVMRQHLLAPVPNVEVDHPTAAEEIRGIVQRAMAKSPSDRFQTAGEMARALETARLAMVTPAGAQRLRPVDARRAEAVTSADTARSTEAPARPESRPRLLRLGAIVAIVAILATVIAIVMLKNRWPGERGEIPVSSLPLRPWVWVAEFEGPEEYASAAQSVVAGAIDESGVFAVVPVQQAKEALKLAGLPESTRIDAERARELAYRMAVRGVITGGVERVGNRFLVTLRAIDVEGDNLLVTLREQARQENDLMSAFTKLGARTSRELGRRYDLLLSQRDSPPIATPVFEAYRRNRISNEAARAGRHDEALAHARVAVQLDPEFALGWLSLGFAYGGLNMEDSAKWAYAEARKHPHRLTEKMRIAAEVDLHDVEGRILTWERLLRINPNSMAVWNNLAIELARVGRMDEAIRAYERAREACTFGTPQLLIVNQFLALLQADRYDEAGSLATNDLEGVWKHRTLGQLALKQGHLTRAQLEFERVVADPLAPLRSQFESNLSLSAALVGQGAVAEASEALESAMRIARLNNNPSWMVRVQLYKWLLAVGDGGASRHPLLTEATGTSDEPVLEALWDAGRGNGAAARAWMARDRLAELQPRTARTIEAWCALGRRDWRSALDPSLPLIRPGKTDSSYEVSPSDAPVALPMSRWIAARAFEESGQPDSAIACLRLATSNSELPVDEVECQLLLAPAIHHRLVQLLLTRGRVDASPAGRAESAGALSSRSR